MTYVAKGTLEERFWSRVDKRGPDECWPWIGAQNGNGYGRIKVDGILWVAHRVAYALATKKWPKSDLTYHGKVVMHRCDNPACCNPAHLQIGTQRRNVMDMVRKGRGKLLVSVPKLCHGQKP
jgi:hypothetical protein